MGLLKHAYNFAGWLDQMTYANSTSAQITSSYFAGLPDPSVSGYNASHLATPLASTAVVGTWTDELGHTTTYTNDLLANSSSQTDAQGKAWVYDRDTLGNVTEMVEPGVDANGAPMAVDKFDEVLVFAHVRLENQTKHPLALQDILANATLGDGILSVSAGNAAQYEEVFLAYPELSALHSTPLPPRTMIAAGQTLDGNAFWAVRRTKQEWDARKKLNFTFRFEYQSSVTLAPRTPVIEQ